MSIVEILEQARNLSLQERKELAKLLIDTLDEHVTAKNQGKTGEEIAAFIKSMPAIEFVDSELEDPTQWLAFQRQKRRKQLENYQAYS